MRILVCSLALILLAACGTDDSAQPIAPREGVADGTLHVLSLNRLQGYAEGIPCDPADIPPLAAAARLRSDLEQAGEVPMLIAIGDTLVPTQVAKAVSKVRLLRVPLRARGDAILDALAAAKVDIYVPGPEDLGDSPERLFDACAERGIPVLLSNLTAPEHPDVKRFIVVTAGSLRIGFMSLLSPGLGTESESNSLALDGIVPCAKRIGRSLREEQQVDLVVVLSNLASKANTMLLAGVENIDFVIGSTDDSTKADRLLIVGNTAVMSSKPAGEELGHTTISIEDGVMQMTDLSPRHQLPHQIQYAEDEWTRYVRTYGTSDPRQLARLAAPGDEAYFLRQVSLIDQNREALTVLQDYQGSFVEHRSAELKPPAKDGPVPAALANQGPFINRSLEHTGLPPMIPPDKFLNIPTADDCMSCHLQQYRFWETTTHARSVDTLTAMDRGRDPTCLECHTTGNQDPAGWFDPRQDAPLGGVTCFSCHSATTVHSGSPRRVVDPLYVVGDADRIMCTTCHTSRRSPAFDREKLLPLVACPPMQPDDPAISSARQKVLDAIGNRRDRGIEDPRDPYLEARALLGLHRDADGFRILSDVVTKNTTDPRLALEAAALFNGGGRSSEALDTLRNFLFFNTGDPDVNVAYVKLLINAADESARDPAAALAHLALLIPEDPGESAHIYLELRLLQIDALFAAGRSGEGFQLLWNLNRDHSSEPGLQERLARYAGD